MKSKHCTELILLLLGFLMLTACSDDDSIRPDTSIPITGYWQIGDEDINGDGAIEGIVVHDDGTITEWQYIESAADPFKLGYKTGKWSLNGNHYELQLSRGDGTYYTVTVRGNDNGKFYLSYQGKASVVPFYRLSQLPGDGNSLLATLETLKYSDITTNDLTGYWEYQDENNTGNNGIYIDAEGNVSEISTLYSSETYHTVSYHSSKLLQQNGVTTFQFLSKNYKVYGIGNDLLLATVDGTKVEKFVRKSVPSEMTRAEKIMNSTVPTALKGTWESTHYTEIINNDTITNVNIEPSDNWAMQLFQRLEIGSDHTIKKYYGSNATQSTLLYFYVDGDALTTSNDIQSLITPKLGYCEYWTISKLSDNELKLINTIGSQTEIYTYKKTK